MNEASIHLITIIIANFSIIWWFRKECREDWLRSQNTIEAIKDEMKDFHEKLLKIENKKN